MHCKDGNYFTCRQEWFVKMLPVAHTPFNCKVSSAGSFDPRSSKALIHCVFWSEVSLTVTSYSYCDKL